MSPEAQQVAIEEWCGWTTKIRKDLYDKYCVFLKDGKPSSTSPPDYLNDLNAMHEAELKLSGTREDENSQLSQYSENLTFACGYPQDPTDIWFIDLIRATAAQRAEALLKTIGRWQE